MLSACLTMISADPRVRKKHVGLDTQQRRLRHFSCVSGHNISVAGLSEKLQGGEDAMVYFTLHASTHTKAFYNSENSPDIVNPRWRRFDPFQFPESINTSMPFIIVKIWLISLEETFLIIEWNVNFKGLCYLGQQLPKNDRKFKANTLVFGMFESYYTSPDSIQGPQSIDIFGNLSLSIATDSQVIRDSCNISSLLRIHTVQRAIKQTQVAILKTRDRIHQKLQLSKNSKHRLATYECQRIKVQFLREELELQKVRKLLDRDQLLKLQAIVEGQVEQLKANCKSLKDEKTKLRENLSQHNEKRELLLKTTADLMLRRRQLISELSCIYPVKECPGKGFTICGVHLPNSEDFAGHDETKIAVALGFVAHSLMMIGQFLDVPLRYSTVHSGSRSRIADHIMDKIPEREREFPLYSKGKEKIHFNYGVYLLNKNVAQLRYYCGMLTQDLRPTLPNLQNLLEMQPGIKLGVPPVGMQGSYASRSGSSSSRGTMVSYVRKSHHQSGEQQSLNASKCSTPATPSSMFGGSQGNPCFSPSCPERSPARIVQQGSYDNSHQKQQFIRVSSGSIFSYSLDKGLDELDSSKQLGDGSGGGGTSNAFCRPKLLRQGNKNTHGSEPNLVHHVAQPGLVSAASLETNGKNHSEDENLVFSPPSDLWATGSSHANSEEEMMAILDGTGSRGLPGFMVDGGATVGAFCHPFSLPIGWGQRTVSHLSSGGDKHAAADFPSYKVEVHSNCDGHSMGEKES